MAPTGPCCVQAKGCQGKQPSENAAHPSWKWRKAKIAGALNNGDPDFDGVESSWEIGAAVCGPCKKLATEKPVHKKRVAEAEKAAAEKERVKATKAQQDA